MPVSPSILDATMQNEENTKKYLITPVIDAIWGNKPDRVLMEFPISDGQIYVDEYGVGHRSEKKKYADYLLFWYRNIPLAIVEAKGRTHSADEGYQQAIDYARLLDVPFAYATNGDDLLEFDCLSGLSRALKLDAFPGPDELWERFKSERHVTPDMEGAYTAPYYMTASGKRPRYYQRVMINRATEAILRGQNRILLVSATGTGKTFTAFQLIWRLWKSGVKRKILYLADRNILVDQSMQNDFAPFADSMTKFDNSNIDTAHELYFALYQQLQNKDKNYYETYPRDFFDLIVIDECHRGSANADSRWRDILDWFGQATKVGLTATPKDDADPDHSNIAYFGEPLYTYSLKQGIEDGFLAPYKVVVAELNIDKFGWLPPEGMKDVYGDPVERRLYRQEEFDRKIIVAERRELVARRISDYLKANDMRYAKTIVFCESVEHAAEMTRLLQNENADLVAEDSRYVMRITGDDSVGKAQLENFIDPGSKYPVIAVTSKLMSTGVDAQTCELVVLDRNVGSMTEFKQIVGRGTRVKEGYEVDGETKSKMYFTILDFRKNYEHFNDPEFDGDPSDVILVPGDDTPMPRPPIEPNPDKPVVLPDRNRIARVNGVDVEIVGEMVQYLDTSGHLVKQNLTACVRNNILSQYPTIEDFRAAWRANHKKRELARSLLLDIDWSESYRTRFGYEVDDFDIVCHFAYGIDPPTSKRRRIESARMEAFLAPLDDDRQELFRLLLDVYRTNTFESLRNMSVFNLPQFADAGWTRLKAQRLFGSKQNYLSALNDLENVIYEKE
ncbi:MAG: DEAD/DEAH box helicase family protein [Atopobiaceae bacterium]|nr:DEAD/DEAH box helicase family protein [Atopobiaceae bacterium]